MLWHGKTVFITGGSRGIGRAIALKAASQGANVVIAAKTDQPHPKLEGTIHTVAEEIKAAGGHALPVVTDVRDEAQIEAAVAKAVEAFGGIDMLINNASAIQLTKTLDTPMKRFDLMMGVNMRATFAATQACIPHLQKADNPHVLMLSPPLNMNSKWFKNHCAYTMSKYGMSMCVLGMSEEFRSHGIAVNALWPRTTIATAAVNMLGGEALMKASRKPEIMADAAFAILKRPSRECTGQFFIDDTVLQEEGVTDLSVYDVTPGARLVPDFFLD
ncbi:MAG: SDR family oxidoreductase [Holosporales bacterium]